MSPLDKAIKIAVDAHAGQVDKAGEPYILHPLRVMLEMPDERTRIVAVLHDVIEDCPRAANWLHDADCFLGELEALVAITRLPEEPYADYIERVGMNPIARTVKMADLRDNLRQDRGEISASHRERYTKALHALVMLSTPTSPSPST